jgi:uncharacterized SAM-binding protein YcdF (DUF218 family)
LLAGLLLVWCITLGAQIVAAGEAGSGERADVAIVLGAAVYGDRPSPVFEERIRHGINLYKGGAVKKLLFTGGYGEGAAMAESLVGSRYAVRSGVPAEAIPAETLSRTTQQNLFHAKRVMQVERLGSALIVTDPLHMKRALRMCEGLGIAAAPSPTPTTRYRTWRTKAGFLLREIYFYNVYLLTGQ